MFLLGIYKKAQGHLGVSSLGDGQQQEARFLKQSGAVAGEGDGRPRKAGLSKQRGKAVKAVPGNLSLTPETGRSGLEGNCALQVEETPLHRAFQARSISPSLAISARYTARVPGFPVALHQEVRNFHLLHASAPFIELFAACHSH